jgi:hypothetical protein
MRDVDEHPTMHGAAQERDHPAPDRRRGDPAGSDGGGVDPGPPQRGGPEEPAAGRKPRVSRDDPASPDGGDINPPPPQRGGDDSPARGAGSAGRHGRR